MTLEEKIDLAFLAIGGEEWNRKACQCDPEVGAVPCEYCVIHDVLKETKKLIFGPLECGCNRPCVIGKGNVLECVNCGKFFVRA